MSAIPQFPMILNLTEPDLTPTEVRSPLSAAFGRIDPYGDRLHNRSPLPAAFGRIDPTAIAFIFA